MTTENTNTTAASCAAPSYTTRASRILFGSCNSQDYPQPLWPVMQSRNATAFVWAGDAIYADRNVGIDFSAVWPPHVMVEPATPDELERIYAQQNRHPGYKSFRDPLSLLTGCWDDHDYGVNNGDFTYQYKQESSELFVKFLGESESSIMMKRAKRGHGAYGVKLLDFSRPVGRELVPDHEAGLDPDLDEERNSSASSTVSDKSVAIFVLDVRSHKTPWYTGKQTHDLNPQGDFLGERQWLWFEEAVSRSRASVNIVVQGLQVHARRYPDGNVAESWDKFPIAQHRLYNALLQQNVKAPFLVSGDVHHAQLMRKDCHHHHHNSAVLQARPLMEITTSGMTHSWGTNFCSRPSSKLCRYPYVQFVLHLFARFSHWISPWNELVVETDEQGRQHKMFSLDLNFAECEFDWDNRQVFLRVMGKEQDAKPLFQSKWTIDELSGVRTMPGGKVTSNEYKDADRVLVQHGMKDSEWVCVPYRGVPSAMHFQLALAASLALPFTLMSLPVLATLLLPLLVGIHLLRRRRPRYKAR